MRATGIHAKILITLAAIAGLISGCVEKAAAAREPGPLFPTATEVRLYVNEDAITVDKAGKVTAGSRPAQGIALSAREIEDIRKAVHFTQPPEWITGCCIPRHAFLFYDRSHRFLGSLTVCFECGCAILQGGPQPTSGKDWIEWDNAVFARVVTAHGQPVDFEAP